MVFPQRGEENLLRRTSSCKNFQPNMFNKVKCQNCFRTREAHDLDSDAANKKPKKVILCGFLFVAPGLDPENPASRSRKWQRRFFVIYETGELCYQLDDNPSTAPQGTVNMYSCTEVYNAKNSIGHDHSMGIVTPDGTLFIKAETREEKDSWFIVLSEYPKINQEAEKYKKKKKKKEERDKEIGSSNIPVRIDSSKEVSSTSSGPSETKPTSSSLGRISSFKENIQPPKRSVDSKSDPRLTSSLHLDSGRTSHLKESDQFNFRRSRSLREKRNSRATVEEEDDHQAHSSTDTGSGEEKEKEKSHVAVSGRKTRTVNDRLSRRHTSPVKQVDFPTPDVSKLRKRDERSSNKWKEDSSDEEEEEVDSKQSEKLPKDGLNTEYMETLHRNNNNVYKSDHIESVSHIPKRKNSTSESGSGRSSRTSSVSEVVKTATLPKPTEPTESAVLTDEEIARLDVPRRGRMRLSKLHGDGETQSPSKRTIEKRRHAKERRSRHTMDSIRVIPILDSDKELEDSQKSPNLKLKRSNSDPNLADTEDALQRKEIAEIFPGLYHLKNGWLNLMGEADPDWSKHWFVLKDNKLSYYKDSKDDISNLEGSFDLIGSVEAVDFTIGRNYGFKVKMRSGSDIVLSAMTAAIRTKWVKALNKAIQTACDGGEVRDVVKEAVQTPKIEDVSESVPDKPIKQADITEVDSNKIETEEVLEEHKVRAPSQRIRDRRSRRGSREDSKRESTSSRLSSESDVFFDAVTSLERKQPEGRSDSPDKGIADTQSGEINEVLEEAVDALKARVKVVEDENATLKVKNSQLMEGLEVLRKYQPENTGDGELLNQIQKLVKHRSKLEQEMEDQKMQLKQMKNAADLSDQKNQELQDQVGSVKVELEKKQGDYNNLQSRFEKLVTDLKEMETERSTTRTKIKEERERTLDVIDRLNQRIEVLETENVELREELKSEQKEREKQIQRCEELEKRLAVAKDDFVIVEQAAPVQATPGGTTTEDVALTQMREQLENALRENRGLLAQLQGANRSTQMLKHKLKEKEDKVNSGNSTQELEELRVEIAEKEDELEALNERLKVVEESRGTLQVKYDRLLEDTSEIDLQKVAELEAKLTQEQDLRLRAEEKVSALEAERDGLGNRIRQYQNEMETLENSKLVKEDQFNLYKQEIDELKEALHSMTAEKTNLQEKNTKLSQDVAVSKNEISTKEEVLEMLQREMKRVKTEWSKHRHEVEKLQLENERLCTKLDEATSETRAWQDKVDELHQRLIEGPPERMESLTEVDQLKEELVRERSSSDSALKNLELEIASKQEQLQMISAQAEDYQKQLQLLQDALKDKAEAVIRLEGELASKSESLSVTQDQLNSKSERLEKEVKRLRSQLLDTQKDFDALEIEHGRLKEEQTQIERTKSEEMRLMSERIQDLTAKLSTAEKKVLAASKDSKGSKHKTCKAREAEAASKIEALEGQVQEMSKKLKITTHKLIDVTTKEVELRKLYQAKCIEGSRYKEQNRSIQRELILLRKKVSEIDNVLEDREAVHQKSLDDLKQSYAIKMRSMEESKRKEQEKDSEALGIALEAVKRVYQEQLQEELNVVQAGTTKDVDAMMRRHTDVVTHMNKDWVIMSSKFSELCRENAHLTSTINGLQRMLTETQERIKETQKNNQSKIEQIASNISELKSEKNPQNEDEERENEKIRMLNITLRLRELELKCAQDELRALKGLQEAVSEVPADIDEPDGAVGGAVDEQYLDSGLKVSAL